MYRNMNQTMHIENKYCITYIYIYFFIAGLMSIHRSFESGKYFMTILGLLLATYMLLVYSNNSVVTGYEKVISKVTTITI